MTTTNLQGLFENKEIRTLLASKLTGVISTSGENGIESAATYYVTDKDFCVYFHTRATSEKFQNIVKDNNVAFVVYTENPAITLQIKGQASVISDMKEAEGIFSQLIERTTKNGLTPPLFKTEKGVIELIKITPTWVRFENFSYDTKEEVLYEVSR